MVLNKQAIKPSRVSNAPLRGQIQQNTKIYSSHIQFVSLLQNGKNVVIVVLTTLPWPFISTMLQMIKACCMLLPGGTSCVELSEREVRCTGYNTHTHTHFSLVFNPDIFTNIGSGHPIQ